jgi:hypothetical protein
MRNGVFYLSFGGEPFHDDLEEAECRLTGMGGLDEHNAMEVGNADIFL